MPTPWNQDVTGLLVHVGDGTPLPEMATLEHARAFAVAAGARLGSSDDPRASATAAVPSALPEGCLLPIPLLAALWTRD